MDHLKTDDSLFAGTRRHFRVSVGSKYSFPGYFGRIFNQWSIQPKCLSYLRPKIWNNLLSDLKSANKPNTFKCEIKENFSKKYKKRKMTYTSSTKTLPHFSPSCFAAQTVFCTDNNYSNSPFSSFFLKVLWRRGVIL